jgi:protein-tyrosine phosphatase
VSPRTASAFASKEDSLSQELAEALIQIRRLKCVDGSLVLGHRPGRKSKGALGRLGLTHVCTLLDKREGPAPVERIAHELGCIWVWIPIAGGGLDILRALDTEAAVIKLARALAGAPHPRVYVHCSAGIHRTGFFASLLLRLQSQNTLEVLAALEALRPVTTQQVGPDRVALAVSRAEGLLHLAGV